MPVWICATCANHYPEAPSPPGACVICSDERQWVPSSGQRWTTATELAAAGRRRRRPRGRAGPARDRVDPPVAIGQRALLVRTGEGNLLWDPPGYLDEVSLQAVADAGGLRAVTASHPLLRVDGRMEPRFDADVLVPEADLAWRTRRRAAPGDLVGLLAVLGGVTLVQCGGHFAGRGRPLGRGAGGAGVLLTGDTIFVTPGEDRVTFVRSAPNRLPLPERAVRAVVEAVRPSVRPRLRRLVDAGAAAGRQGGGRALGRAVHPVAAREVAEDGGQPAGCCSRPSRSSGDPLLLHQGRGRGRGPAALVAWSRVALGAAVLLPLAWRRGPCGAWAAAGAIVAYRLRGGGAVPAHPRRGAAGLVVAGRDPDRLHAADGGAAVGAPRARGQADRAAAGRAGDRVRWGGRCSGWTWPAGPTAPRRPAGAGGDPRVRDRAVHRQPAAGRPRPARARPIAVSLALAVVVLAPTVVITPPEERRRDARWPRWPCRVRLHRARAGAVLPADRRGRGRAGPPSSPTSTRWSRWCSACSCWTSGWGPCRWWGWWPSWAGPGWRPGAAAGSAARPRPRRRRPASKARPTTARN